MSSSNWCQIKTALLLPIHHEMTEACGDDTIFDYDWNAILPEGWDFKGSDISGAAGYVLLFEVDHLPTEPEVLIIETKLGINT